MDTEEKEITVMEIAESAIGKYKSKEIRDLLVAALALGIESYKDLCVEDACKKQREICANTITLSYFVDDDAEKRGNDHIRNAPMPIEDDAPEEKLLIRELDELIEYGFERIQTEGAADIESVPEYIKMLEGVRWGVHVEDADGGEKKVCITNNKRTVRYCDTMEAMTEKLIEYKLLK